MILGWLTRNRKIYIGRSRLHHGRVGAYLALLGLALVLDDLLDYPWRWHD